MKWFRLILLPIYLLGFVCKGILEILIEIRNAFWAGWDQL